MSKIGEIKKLVRYPVKSMAGIEMENTFLGWQGLAGDRRLGIRKVDDEGDFPWLTASKLPELLLYQPTQFDSTDSERKPRAVQTPTGKQLDITDIDLRTEIGEQAGVAVEFMALKQGIFDDAVLSVIASVTADHICNDARVQNDSRRFRANIEINCDRPIPFAEDDWVGCEVTFGEAMNAPTIYVTKRDVRCKMIGLDPDSAEHDPAVIKSAIKLNDNHAGIYATVIRTGNLKVGDPVFLNHRAGQSD